MGDNGHAAPMDAGGFDRDWIEDTARRATATLRASVQEAPYSTLGAALGVGLVAGGGLWQPLGRALVGFGARIALSAVVPALIDRMYPAADGNEG